MPANFDYFPFDTGSGANTDETRWGKMMRYMRTTGIISASTTLDPSADDLAVTPLAMVLGVQTAIGKAWIQGFYFEQTDDYYAIGLNPNTSGNPRIDLLVLQLNLVDDTIVYAVLEGTPAMSPVAPSPQQDDDIWELPLAQIYVADSATIITSMDITDERVRSMQGDGGSTAVTFANAGTTSLVASTSSPPDLKTKGLVAGTNISFSTSGTDVTINASSAPADSPVCILYRDSNQTISSGMSAAITWSDVILDPDGLWDSTTGIVAPEDGTYEIIANVDWTGSATSNGTVSAAIQVNATTVSISHSLAVGSVVVSNNVAVLADLTTSDVVTVLATNDSGVSLDVKTGGTFAPYVALLKVRS